MSRWVPQPVSAGVGPDHTPTAFTWRGQTYRVRVIGR
jgi:hypothetical protein